MSSPSVSHEQNGSHRVLNSFDLDAAYAAINSPSSVSHEQSVFPVPPNSPADAVDVPNSPYVCSCSEDEFSPPGSPNSTSLVFSFENPDHSSARQLRPRADTPYPHEEESKNNVLEMSGRDP